MNDDKSNMVIDTAEDWKLTDNWIKDYLIPKLINDGKIYPSCCTIKCDSTCECTKNMNNNNNKSVIELVSVEVKPVSIDGFMLSAPCKVQIEYRRKHNCSNATSTSDVAGQQPLEKMFVIVKRTPNIPKDMYIGCQFDFLFQNELIAYTEIIPLLSQAKKYPRFYYSERKELSAVCVLEDFSQYGWKTAKQLYNLPLQHILLAVREIATFHGEMYALKLSNLNLFNSIVSRLKEPRFGNDTIVTEYDNQLIVGRKRIVEALRNSDMSTEVPESFTDMFMEYTKHPLTCFKKQIFPLEPHAVLCHGDYLRNNIAFKFDDKGFPTDVMMYDFQTLRYASPMLDIVILLLVSASHEVRHQHFDEIFTFYIKTLTDTYCTKLELPSDAVPIYMTMNDFKKEYTRCIPYGLMIAASFLPILYEPLIIEGNILETSSAISAEDMIKNVLTRGGKPLDIELTHMFVEFYNLCKMFDIKFE